MSDYLQLQNLVNRLRSANGYPFLEGYKARVLGLAEEIQCYINKGFFVADARAQASRSLNPEKFDVFSDLAFEIIERKQGIYKEKKVKQ